jgi:CDP-4-dehydro-6-deoxyglucose reductase
MHEKLVNAKIDSIIPLTDSVLQLHLVPDTYIDYQAGQYLQILFQEETLSYSIANAPLGSHKYELHIRHSLNNPINQALLAEIKSKGCLTLRLPLGVCRLSDLSRENALIFIAGGTGFAPIKAMIEQLLMDADPRNFELYWLARSQSDLYLDSMVDAWQSHVKTFRYFSLLSGNTQDKLITLLNARHQKDFAGKQFVISGPFDMVYHLRDKLTALGVSEKAIFSDAFSFEQKKE